MSDQARVLQGDARRRLAFRGEVYLDWDPSPPMFSGDYCLVFGRPA